MNKDKDKKERGEVSRRDFLVGAGAVVVGGAIGAGITYPLVSGGDGEVSTVTKTVETTKTVSVPTTVTTTVGDGATATVTDTVTTTVGDGATVTKTVTTTTGGDGVSPALEPEKAVAMLISYGINVMMDVKNGRIVRGRRIRYEDEPNYEPWSLTARGVTWNAPTKSSCSPIYFTHRKRVDSPNRILYPLKRVDWEPGGDPDKINPQNRGISNYKRISWDEAAGIVASEMRRVADTYGTSALGNVWSGGHPESRGLTGDAGVPGTFLDWWARKEYGTPITGNSGAATTSSGGQMGGQYVIGRTYQQEDVLKDIAENCDMLLGWGCEPEHHAWIGGTGHLSGMWYKWFKDIGIKQVYIVPDITMGVGRLVDKWIPVVPTTDAAMMCAIAYTWITEATYDQDYLDTHTVGFDIFRAYVMGEEDGIPKTPQWASPICGVTEWTIKALAREWASKPTTIAYGVRGGGAVGRSLYAHNAQRIQLYLQCMQGLFGPGKNQFIGLATFGSPTRPKTSVSIGSTRGSSYLSAARSADETPDNPPSRERPYFPRDRFYNATYEQPTHWYTSNDQFYKRTYPLEGFHPVRFIWGGSASFSASRQWGHGFQKGIQSSEYECVVYQNMYLEDGMVFADIILPVTVVEEQPNIYTAGDTAHVMSVLTEPASTPIGEAKNDYEVLVAVADKLGWEGKLTEGGKDYHEMMREHIIKGYEDSGIADQITWDEIEEKTYFVQGVDMAWYDREPAMRAFYNDPAASPLRTPTGLLEIESQELLEGLPDDEERPPVARYVIGGPDEERWAHNEYPYGSKAETYPLMMVSNTSIWKHHSMCSDIPWTREVEKVIGWDGYAYAPCWLHPEDAEPRGIKDGDIVRVFNDRGGVLGGAVITERVRPGSVKFEKAGGSHHIIPGELDQGGNTNCISTKWTMSKVCYGLSAINYLCEVEKVTGNMMDEWRENYPEAFNRNREAYGPERGPHFAGWVEGAK